MNKRTKNLISYLLVFCMMVTVFSACDKKDQMVKLAEMNLRQSVDYPKQLKILAVSDPQMLAKVKAYAAKLKNEVKAKDAKLAQVGYKNYDK